MHTAFNHPVVVAKQLATADRVGGGRAGINIVAGWNEPEYRALGADLPSEHDARCALAQEWWDVIRRIWTEDGCSDLTAASSSWRASRELHQRRRLRARGCRLLCARRGWRARDRWPAADQHRRRFLSFSHAAGCGLFSLVEVVEQLRHEAGQRQVPGAELGFVSGGVGGMMQCSSAAVLGRV